MVGNSKGLLVPSTTRDNELKHLRNSLPDKVKIQRIDEKLSPAVVVTNDYVALVHLITPEHGRAIKDVLGVEVFRQSKKDVPVGSYCSLSNQGCLVHPNRYRAKRDLVVAAGARLRGNRQPGQRRGGAGMVVNDWAALRMMTRPNSVIEYIFNLLIRTKRWSRICRVR